MVFFLLDMAVSERLSLEMIFISNRFLSSFLSLKNFFIRGKKIKRYKMRKIDFSIPEARKKASLKSGAFAVLEAIDFTG
jgi:hypothetical protein